MAAALAPSTALLTFSSTEQDTLDTTGLTPKTLLTDAGRTVFSNLELEAKEAETLHPTEATVEAAIAPSFGNQTRSSCGSCK